MKNMEIQFSFNQFLVYDSSVSMPGCLWTDTHIRQGFARRESVVCFGTILEFGKASLSVYLEPYPKEMNHDRAISTPFKSPTGKILIEGPEESNTNRYIELEPGFYNLTAAQKVVDYCEEIELFFEKVIEPNSHSMIIIADDELDPPDELKEYAEIAEV